MTKEKINRLNELARRNFNSLNKDEENEFFRLLAEESSEINFTLLPKLELEARDRVGYERNTSGNQEELSDLAKDKILHKVEEIENNYDAMTLNPDDSEYYFGYGCGILSLSRFLLGDYGTDINLVRSGKDLLDD